MNKQGAIELAELFHRERIREIEAADKISKKVDPLLPKGWVSKMEARYGNLVFTKGEKADVAEFRVVCGLVEKATGKTVTRSGAGGKHYIELEGNCFFDVSTKDDGVNFLTVRIKMNPDDSCKFTLKRHWYTEAHPSEGCLGGEGA